MTTCIVAGEPSECAELGIYGFWFNGKVVGNLASKRFVTKVSQKDTAAERSHLEMGNGSVSL